MSGWNEKLITELILIIIDYISVQAYHWTILYVELKFSGVDNILLLH